VVEILGSNAKKIILDLRNNPGGYLEVSQEIAGWFLENGQVVTIEDFGGKQEQNIYKARGSANLLPYPMVILINQGSASASEILAGALRDNRGIKLIGETSFGKGSVQEIEDLVGGSSLKITIAKWLTPKGESISEKGLEPDIKVEMTDEDYSEGRDPQLDKAIEIIKNLE
jgi:carboxyl-terminal processing protease